MTEQEQIKEIAQIICDECKEAIKYVKDLRKKEVMKNRNSISYKYVDRYFASVDKEDWDDMLRCIK